MFTMQNGYAIIKVIYLTSCLVACFSYIALAHQLNDHLRRYLSAHTWPRAQMVTHPNTYQKQSGLPVMVALKNP